MCILYQNSTACVQMLYNVTNYYTMVYYGISAKRHIERVIAGLLVFSLSIEYRRFIVAHYIDKNSFNTL